MAGACKTVIRHSDWFRCADRCIYRVLMIRCIQSNKSEFSGGLYE